MLILLSIGFLEKVPKEFFCTYEGSTEERTCVPEDFCNDPSIINYRPNMELDDSYQNWV